MTSRPSAGTRLRLAVLAACLGCLPLAPPVQAEDGARKVGSSYVIRFRDFDLGKPTERLALLEEIERSAALLCKGQNTVANRDACVDVTIASSLKSAPARVRRAVKTARLERDAQQQAQR